MRTLVMGLDGMDVMFKLLTLDDLDSVSNLNQSIWVWLISQDIGPIDYGLRIL